MRFLMTFNATDSAPPSPEQLEELGKLTEEMMRSGKVIATGGILPLSHGARVRQAGGKFTVLDGPFPETKELIVGYAIAEASSREEAIEMCRRFMKVAGDGDGEIRQLIGGPEDHG